MDVSFYEDEWIQDLMANGWSIMGSKRAGRIGHGGDGLCSGVGTGWQPTGRHSVNERGHSEGKSGSAHWFPVAEVWCAMYWRWEQGMGVLVVTMAKGRHSVYSQRFSGGGGFVYSIAGRGDPEVVICTKWKGGLCTFVFELAGSQPQSLIIF